MTCAIYLTLIKWPALSSVYWDISVTKADKAHGTYILTWETVLM